MRNKIIVGMVGAGGDGVVTVGELLLKIAQLKGYYGRLSRYYDAQIRGGGSAVKINLYADKAEFSEADCDILFCLNEDKLNEFKDELPVNSKTAAFGGELLAVFGEISQEITGTRQSKNLAVLGFLLEILGWGQIENLEALKPREKILSDKNIQTIQAGQAEARKHQTDLAQFQLEPVAAKQTIIIDGNQAVARGAIKAGCRFAATYPITPASDIGEYFSRELPRVGGVFVQGESEIASINMALGASLAGAKAMTATSGPGFDLMVETINLASSCEIPLVVVDVQRVGPSTGIATKVEQADLSSAIFSGHGYAPRVVLAPYNLEGCYRLAIEAFYIAEKYQVPVILLSDQYLGQTSQISDTYWMRIAYLTPYRFMPAPESAGKYLRYESTPYFISPMSLPGMPGFEWRAAGLTHDERGNPSGSSEWHQKMQEKITKKLNPLRERYNLVRVFGNPKARTGLISWGSSGEAALSALRSMGLENKVKVCIPELIAPVPVGAISDFLKGLRKLIIVEMNYSGQYRRYLSRYFRFPKQTHTLKRAGGRPWSQKEMTDFFKEVL